MFGYRLIRDADYKELIGSLAREQLARIVSNEASSTAIQMLLRELGEAKSHAAARGAMYDLIVVRANILEHDNATLRSKVTGLPTIAPSIGKGSPIDSTSLGAGVDLFADVGDEQADRLRNEGVLHDDVSDIPPMPSAADLAPGA